MQRAAKATTEAEELEKSLQVKRSSIQLLKRDMVSEKAAFEQGLQTWHTSYGALIGDMKHLKKKMMDLSGALHSCEAEKMYPPLVCGSGE